MLMKFHGTLIISLMILIYVIRNGGSDHQIAPSKRVNIHTKKGIVKGVLDGQLSILEKAKRRNSKLVICSST
jgi:putative aminopeptidase FrvX